MASVCGSLGCLISALTQAGRGGLLFRVLVPSLCGEEGRCFPVHAAQGPGCSIWSGPCVACGPSFRVFHESADSVAPALCAFPSPSSSGSQELGRHTLPGCGAPSPLLSPSGRVHAPCVQPRPSRWMSTIQNLTKSLVRNWRPVCSVVGDAISGAESAPFPSLLPPASCLQRGWAG